MLIITLTEAIGLGLAALFVAWIVGARLLVFVFGLPDAWREWRCKHEWRDAHVVQKFATGTTIHYPVRRCDKCDKETRR